MVDLFIFKITNDLYLSCISCNIFCFIIILAAQSCCFSVHILGALYKLLFTCAFVTCPSKIIKSVHLFLLELFYQWHSLTECLYITLCLAFCYVCSVS